MKVTAVFINIQESDQYDKVKKVFIGIYSDKDLMNVAIAKAGDKFRKKRHYVETFFTHLNCEVEK